MEYLGRSSFCSGKFLVEVGIPFAFKLVELEIFLNGKHPKNSHASTKYQYTFGIINTQVGQ